MSTYAIPTDADIEMLELAELDEEDAAETCQACRKMYASVTFFISADHRTEVYECVCGHRAVWINRRRLS